MFQLTLINACTLGDLLPWTFHRLCHRVCTDIIMTKMITVPMVTPYTKNALDGQTDTLGDRSILKRCADFVHLVGTRSTSDFVTVPLLGIVLPRVIE